MKKIVLVAGLLLSALVLFGATGALAAVAAALMMTA